MSAEYIENIQELAARFRDDERNLVLYFPDLETPPPDDSYNRVFGPPVGLTDERWPTFPELSELLQHTEGLRNFDPRDTRMEHVFTIDLRGIDLLGAPADADAMMLFISNASFHRASRLDSPHTAVLFLTGEELERGPYRGQLPARSLYRWSRRFSLVPIAVPGEVFDVPQLDLLPDDLLVELYEAIREAPARLGGCPVALDDDEDTGWDDSVSTLPWSVEEFEVDLGDLDGDLEDKRTRAYQALRQHASASSTHLTMAYAAVAAEQSPTAPHPAFQSAANLTMPYQALSSASSSARGLPAHQSAANLTMPYAAVSASLQGPTGAHLAFQSAANLTMPYAAVSQALAESEVFEQRRTLMRGDRLLDRRHVEAYDGDPASALTFGHRAPRRPPAASSPFLMQFQRRFADVNLGQRGVMYVSDRGAFVPSH